MSSYVCLGMSNLTYAQWGWYTCILGSVLMGISSALGEATILGFNNNFKLSLNMLLNKNYKIRILKSLSSVIS